MSLLTSTFVSMHEKKKKRKENRKNVASWNRRWIKWKKDENVLSSTFVPTIPLSFSFVHICTHFLSTIWILSQMEKCCHIKLAIAPKYLQVFHLLGHTPNISTKHLIIKLSSSLRPLTLYIYIYTFIYMIRT